MRPLSRLSATILTAAVFTVLAPAVGAAATFVVDSTDDAVDAAPGDGSCATAGGACTLRAAVQELNARQSFDTVEIPAGLYALTIAPSGQDDDDATGSLDVRGGTIVGAGRDVTVVDGGGLDVVFAFSGADNRISGLTVQHGTVGIVNALQSLAVDDVLVTANAEAGIDAPNLTLTDSEVRDNGGVGVRTGGNFPQITRSVIRRNLGRGVEGSAESLSITDSRISGNTATGDGGGIAFCEILQLTHTIVTNNSATGNGGGIASNGNCAAVENRSHQQRAVPPAFFGKLRVSDSVVNGNRATGDGGGLWVGAGLLLERSSVDGNTAGGNGGGIWGTSGVAPDLAINQSTISRNHALDGGGLYKIVGTSGRESLVNSTVAGNQARRNGGGLFLTGSPIGLHNVTIADNTADGDDDGEGDGGGIFAPDAPNDVVLENSILATNHDAGGEAPDCSGGVQSRGFDLIGTTAGCTIDGDDTGNVVGADPDLGPLQDNNGPTETMAPAPGSPAIDAGNPKGCTDHDGDPLLQDQRRVVRPQGPGCDMGAVENRCGNGVVEGYETCDDGNTRDGDCCSADCRLEAEGSTCSGGDDNVCTTDTCDAVGVCHHEFNTLPCDDGNACTTGDVCSGGKCLAATTTTCEPCETCDENAGCIVGPRPSCLQGTKRFTDTLELIDKSEDSRDRLTWSWTKGETTTREDLGDPLNGENYAFCLYDESQAAPRLVLSAVSRPGQCGGKPCWKSLNAKTVKYKDSERLPDGIDSVVLKTGDAGKAKVTVTAKGEHLVLPALPLPLPLRVQLQSETGACWEARYLEPGVAKNTVKQFRAKALQPAP